MATSGPSYPQTISAEEAVHVVKKGDRVNFTVGVEPLGLAMAIFSRGVEVGGIHIYIQAAGRDLPQYERGWEHIFDIEVGHILPIIQPAIDERRAHFMIPSLTVCHEPTEPIDLLVTQVSPPDEHGNCSLGSSVWNKRKLINRAKVVAAEINPKLIRTYGESYVHFSEIDFFVEHVSDGRAPGKSDLLGRKLSDSLDKLGPMVEAIGGYVASLIDDGDTLQVGVGSVTERLMHLPTFDDKHDLGWHSEVTPPPIVNLVRKGIMTGARKTLHRNKAIATAVGGGAKEDLDFVNMNPAFELYDSDYVINPLTIAQHDNMVAINAAVNVDLTGQIAAESIGPRMISGTGGQLAFAAGAALSRGGRSMVVMTSTAQDGTQSRIVPQLAPGTVVSVPRALADIVITEHGVAKLKGKTERQRAFALAAIAHPDLRADLRKAAETLF